MFLTNAVIGLWPVRRIETIELAVGPLTRRLVGAVDEILARETPD
jgi:branched-subunit amino acid aminotransferase/4-amino-4-deoxychorismate lyase